MDPDPHRRDVRELTLLRTFLMPAGIPPAFAHRRRRQITSVEVDRDLREVVVVRVVLVSHSRLDRSVPPIRSALRIARYWGPVSWMARREIRTPILEQFDDYLTRGLQFV